MDVNDVYEDHGKFEIIHVFCSMPLEWLRSINIAIMIYVESRPEAQLTAY
jgi:hypothetical protein